MIALTGLTKKGQFEPGGVAVGGGVRIGPGPGRAGRQPGKPGRRTAPASMSKAWRPIEGRFARQRAGPA